MASGKKLVLYLDQDDYQPATTPKKKSRKTTTRSPRIRTPRSAVNEPDESDGDSGDDDGDNPNVNDGQTSTKVKRERCNSVDSGEEPSPKRQTLGRPSKKTFMRIVAIDFGMWGCGMSMSAPSGHPKDVKEHTTWPKNGGVEVSKFPAITALKEDNTEHAKFQGREEAYTAFEIPNGVNKITFPKICMSRDIAPSPFDDDVFKAEIAKKMVKPWEQSKNERAMVAILKYILKVHRDESAKVLGRRLRDDDNVHFVFTYPAACNEAGQQTLRNAVKEAGFEVSKGDKVTYTSEAHGAACAAFIDSQTSLGDDFKEVFKKNKAVTVLDIGALTVDATTITTIGTDAKLRIGEVGVSNGGNCGTTAIVCRILRLMEEKFGSAFSDIPADQFERGTVFYKGCETILRTFEEPEPGEKHNFTLRLAAGFKRADYNAEIGEVYLDGFELQRAFDGTIECMKGIVRDQWRQSKKRTDIIPTGGGSLCPYIDEQMSIFCDEEQVRYIRTPKRDSAVCRGAFISAMNEDFFGRRVSRGYFGIMVNRESRSYIHWFISRGDKINVKKGVTVSKLPGRLILTVRDFNDMLNGTRQRLPRLLIYTFRAHLEEGQEVPNQPGVGVEVAGEIPIDGSGFSHHFSTKLAKDMRKGTVAPLEATVAVNVDDSGRLTFVVKAGKVCLGRGELRYDVTDADAHAGW